MSEIERAIESLQNIIEYWTYKPEEMAAAKLAIEALKEKQQREDAGATMSEIQTVEQERTIAAMTRAIKTKIMACATCAKKPEEGYCLDLYDCICETWSYPHWEFDIERFSAEQTELEG